MTAIQPPHISQLQQHLLDTLKDLRDRTHPMEPDRARAVAQVAGVLVDSARVMVEFAKVTGNYDANFVAPQIDEDEAPRLTVTPGDRNGITSITQHRLQG